MAKINVYMTGHGKWDIEFAGRGTSSIPGFTTTPKGCKVVFYIHNAKTMMPSDVWSILEGNYNGAPESEYGEFRSVPEMKLSPVSSAEREEDFSHFLIGQNKLPEGSIFYSPTMARPLSAVMERIRENFGRHNEYIFHWLCCRFVPMKGENSGNEGVNARELLDRQVYQLLDRTNGGKRFIREVAI